MNKAIYVYVSLFTAILLTHKGVQAQPTSWVVVHEQFQGTGITCISGGGKLMVRVGGMRWPFPIAPQHLDLLKDIGPIDDIDVSYHPGFRSEDYTFLENLHSVKKLQIMHHYDGECNKLLSSIAKCRGLRSLTLVAHKLNEADMGLLSEAENLTELFIVSRGEDFGYFNQIANLDLTALRISNSSGARPKYADLRPLLNMKALNRLEFKGSELSEHEKKQLSKALGDCDIRFDIGSWREIFSSL